MLYTELCEEYQKFYPTDFGYETNRVHCEYFGGEGTRVDVVVLDERDIKNIKSNALTKKKLTDHIHLSDAIEIKTVLGWYGSSRRGLAKDDIKKLVNVKTNNPKVNLYYIYIVRWPTKKKEKQKEILDLVNYLKVDCKRKGIKFNTNDSKNYFLGK